MPPGNRQIRSGPNSLDIPSPIPFPEWFLQGGIREARNLAARLCQNSGGSFRRGRDPARAGGDPSRRRGPLQRPRKQPGPRSRANRLPPHLHWPQPRPHLLPPRRHRRRRHRPRWPRQSPGLADLQPPRHRQHPPVLFPQPLGPGRGARLHSVQFWSAVSSPLTTPEPTASDPAAFPACPAWPRPISTALSRSPASTSKIPTAQSKSLSKPFRPFSPSTPTPPAFPAPFSTTPSAIPHPSQPKPS